MQETKDGGDGEGVELLLTIEPGPNFEAARQQLRDMSSGKVELHEVQVQTEE